MLRNLGIKGVRNTVRMLNPIVRWYRQKRGESGLTSITHLDGHHLHIPASRGQDKVQLPAAIKQFLDAFDRGDYPDLEEPTTSQR